MARTEYTDRVAEGLLCCVPGCTSPGGYRPGTACDPHHVHSKGALGKQVDERNVAPVCHTHHREGHSIGWDTWQQRYGVCLAAVALLVYVWWCGGHVPELRKVRESADMEW